VKSLFEQAEEHLHRGELKEAESALQKFIFSYPKDGMAHNKLGIIYAHQDNFEEAKKCFQEALLHDPNLVQAINNLGNLAREAGDLSLAIEYYKKAIALDSDYSVPHNNLAVVYKQLNQYNEFVKEIKLAKRLEARLKGERPWRRLVNKLWPKRHCEERG